MRVLANPFLITMGQSLVDNQPNLTSFHDISFRYKDYYYEADLTKAPVITYRRKRKLK